MKNHANFALQNLKAITDFSKLINSSLELNFILNNLLLTCFGKLHSTFGAVYLLNEEGKFELKIEKGARPNKFELTKWFTQEDYSTESKIDFILPDELFPVKLELKGTRGVLGLFLLGNRLTGDSYSQEDFEFLKLILNVSSTAIENAIKYLELIKLNRELDRKVNRLSSLFEITKEFASVIEKERVGKLLVYSLIGQLMVTDYAIVLFENEQIVIIESKFKKEELVNQLKEKKLALLEEPLFVGNDGEAPGEIYKLGVRLIIPMRFKDETRGLIFLGERKNNKPFTRADAEFVNSLASVAIVSIENWNMIEEIIEKKKIEKELETAKSIQKSLLPQELPDSSSFDFAAVSHSARQVGGDYYDAIRLSESKVLVAIADVSGKGVQAALLMSNLQAFLKSISKQNIPLEEATNMLNSLVSENTTMGNFITFFWGILDEENLSFTFVNAGHNPPIWRTADDIRFLTTGGMLLGLGPTVVPYKSETIKLHSKDRLVLFTDGITEAMNKNLEEYSLERLIGIVRNCKGSSVDLLDEILQDVKNHTGYFEQSDDITALIITALK